MHPRLSNRASLTLCEQRSFAATITPGLGICSAPARSAITFARVARGLIRHIGFGYWHASRSFPMKRFRGWIGALVATVFALAIFCPAARAAEMTAEQKDAVNKLQAKGGLVIPIAANTDALDVSLATAGKSAGGPELALVKVLPKVEKLDLRGTAITDAGLANTEGFATLTPLHLETTPV